LDNDNPKGTMRRLAKKIWKFLHNRHHTPVRQKPTARSRWRPRLEALEDRLTPSTAGFPSTAPAVLTGSVYVDSNNNNIRDPGELGVPGMNVTLAGTTNQGTAVNLSAVTDATGTFTFFQLAPGTYRVSRSTNSNFIDAQSSVGNLGGTVGSDSISTISIAEGQAAVNYNMPMRGVILPLVSLRLFLSTPTPVGSFSSAAGAGFTAADNSVQPATAPTPGTASLAGSVLDSTGKGIAGVGLALTGIDSTGRALVLTTTTGTTGGYQFSALQGGTFTLNVINPPSGFRTGQPAVGSQGGQVFRNDQIADITLAAGASGTGYNFTEIASAAPTTGPGPALMAELADDTSGPGGTTSDGITSDPSVHGTLNSASLVRFQAGLDGASLASFVDIQGNVTPGGSFYLNPARLAQIAGGTLADGAHTLHFRAQDAQGHVSTVDVTFTLDTAAPSGPTLKLDSTSDPTGSGRTTSNNVTLQGTTSPGVQVVLTQGTTTLTATADPTTGAFSFSNITLTSGANNFTVQATDKAGNTSQLTTFFVLENAPVAVATSPVAVSLSKTASDTFRDLSDPTLFTDADMSNSLITFNTSAGPINVQLFDTQAPQTVANFLDYINQGAYNNDIFHRLPTPPFVLQGGGFTFNSTTHTLTPVNAGPNVPNEFDNTNRPNVVGTIAMAKLGGDPNSATSQFFFNIVDNTQELGGTNNGGFTVFGKVVSGADQRVINTFSAFPVQNQSKTNSALDTLPLQNYTGTNFPTDATAANFALINSVTVVRNTEQLSYSIVSNDNSAIVTATIKQGQLDLKPTGVGTGTANIVVQATDLAGQTATVTFTVTVS
jgi:cyclophilin family peptidyl-prolyl cis-trans isomerase